MKARHGKEIARKLFFVNHAAHVYGVVPHLRERESVNPAKMHSKELCWGGM